MKALVITGATTPLGAGLADAAIASGVAEKVICAGAEPIDRVSRRFPSHRMRYVQVDLTRSRSLRELLFGLVVELGAEAVVHAATHRRAADSGEKVHALNVDATRELLHLCDRHPTLRRFVFSGHAEVYRAREGEPLLIGEEHPLETSPQAPQWLRDRVEADQAVCAALGVSPLSIIVLRCAECFAPDTGSQLWDYTRSTVCLRPLGFDPVLNLISLPDLVRAHLLALQAKAQGVFNVPGADTLPLSEAVARAGATGVPLPGPLLSPLYSLRRLALRFDFRWDLVRARFHFGGVLDGARARRDLGYAPEHGVDWRARR